MRRLLYSRTIYKDPNTLEYNPLLKHLIVDDFTPTLK